MKDFDFYLRVLKHLNEQSITQFEGDYDSVKHKIMDMEEKEKALRAEAEKIGIPFNIDAMRTTADNLGFLNVDWDSSSMNC